MTVTIRDIAKHLNLSVATISRAFNGYTDIAPATRQRIFDTAKELGYYPSDSARSLRRRQTNRFGILVPSNIDFMGEYFSELIRGVTIASAKADCNVMLYTTLTDEADKLQRICQAREVDGIILISSPQLVDSIPLLKKKDMPYVIIGHPVDDPEVSYIVSDNFKGNLLAMRHLISLGHSRIAYIGRADQPWINKKRIAGYSEALSESNIPMDETLIKNASHGIHTGCEEMSSLLTMASPPSAVLAFNDQIAVNALQVALSQGLSVPADLAIAGYNDIRSSLSTTPQLTSVRQPLPEMGQAAVEILREMATGKTIEPMQLTLPVSLKVRNSTTL